MCSGIILANIKVDIVEYNSNVLLTLEPEKIS